MVPNSKLFPKIVIASFLVVACGATGIDPAPSCKCQAVVVVDKTNSVSFTDRLPQLQQELTRDLEYTYGNTTKDIQISHLIITGHTRVFPVPDHFYMDYPSGEEGSRSYEEQLHSWNIAKRKWIADEVKQVVSLIESPCNDNTTDIFSIFSGIQQVQKNNGPWDSVKVFIFSDMINTCNPINLVTGITVNNAYQKGKKVCENLIDHGLISKGNTQNLHLTIYTPANMNQSAKVSQFWKGFFEQWGLQDYQFE